MRKEIDFIGEMELPADALYGIHAARARENFPDTTPFHREWYQAVGLVKKACYQTAEAYHTAVGEKFGAGKMKEMQDRQGEGATRGLAAGTTRPDHATRLTHLIHATSEVAEGDHVEDFIVPAVSGGAGTSINMNINEIITNVALLKLGAKPGSYHLIDPIEDANIYQSTNDVIPTSLKVAAMFLLQDLEKAINAVRFDMEQMEITHQNDLRPGYTQMQEAVPTSFGKLFSTYSEALSRDWWRVSKCFERIKEVNLGGSAIGTGMAVPRYFIMEAAGHLQQLTGLPVTRSENLSDATSNLDSFVEIHATLKAHAVNLEKMVSDIRLLASDLTGGSLSIPQCQVGSSIMPGKVNPVIPEFVISAAHKVYANDQLISSLSAQGCLELNAYLPVIGHALLESLKLLTACDRALKNHLFNALAVRAGISLERLLSSPSITTALIPAIGYHKAAELAAMMKSNGISIFEANTALHTLSEEKLRNLLKAENLLKLGYTLSEVAG